MRVASLAALAAFALVACASDTDPGEAEDVEVAADALVGGTGIVGPVVVEADRLVVPRAGNDALVDLRPGRVLVGGPDRTAGNPHGFLRKAVSSDVLGDRIVVVTEPAELGDVIKSGTLHARSGLDATPRIGTASGGARASERGVDITFGDKTLLETRATFRDRTSLLPLRRLEIERSVRLTGGHLRFTPSVDLDLAIRRGKVDRFTAVARGELDAAFALTFDTKTSIALDKNPEYRDALQRFMRAPALSVNLYESPPHPLGMQWVGPVPVVETVRYRIVLECDVEMNTDMHGEASVEVQSRAAFGATYRDGAWSAVERPTLTARPTFVLTRSGQFAGSCGLRGEVGFYFYDLAGPTLAVTPYAVYDVQRAEEAWTYEAWPGFRGTFGGRAQVLGWELLRGDLVLFDARPDTPLRGAL